MGRALTRRIEALEGLRKEISGNPWSVIVKEVSDSALQAIVEAGEAGKAGCMSSAQFGAEVRATLKRDAPNEGTLRRWMGLLGEA